LKGIDKSFNNQHNNQHGDINFRSFAANDLVLALEVIPDAMPNLGETKLTLVVFHQPYQFNQQHLSKQA
jgi:hypothetical protein